MSEENLLGRKESGAVRLTITQDRTNNKYSVFPVNDEDEHNRVYHIEQDDETDDETAT